MAITLLLERALGRRTVTVKGRHVGLRLPTWPLLALWLYFAGSVAGNIGHAPPVLAAQLVASAPPVSAALTFHLLLRLLDRATLLRAIAEGYEERSVEQKERAAVRRARRVAIKSGSITGADGARGDGDGTRSSPADADHRHPQLLVVPAVAGEYASSGEWTAAPTPADAPSQMTELRDRVRLAVAAGDRVTGQTVGRRLGVSSRTGRRRLAALLDDSPVLADAVTTD